MLSVWEDSAVGIDEFTLCPSGALASLITLGTIRAHGVDTIVFETPCYFGTVEQAEELGFRIELIPTYRAEDYVLKNPAKRLRLPGRRALWLTQPRVALGWDQTVRALQDTLQSLDDNFLIIDEVTDQSFPAHLRSLRRDFPTANIIRIRSFTKPMGLNGFRLSAIMHPERLRKSVTDALELFGGTLDAHSVLAVNALADDVDTLERMLKAVNGQVNTLRIKAERLSRGSPVIVNRLVNGYIGSMIVDLSSLGRNGVTRRRRFLENCERLRTPVILGPSFYLAKDPPLEGVRLNFFQHSDQVLRGVSNVLKIVS